MRGLKISTRCIVAGKISGEVLYSSSPIAFLQGVDPEKGWVSSPEHEIFKKPFSGKILVFPNSVGSSVGSYVIYRLKKERKAPKGMINQSADIITASGCAIADIPLYDLPKNSISELKGVRKIFLDESKSEIKVL